MDSSILRLSATVKQPYLGHCGLYCFALRSTEAFVQCEHISDFILVNEFVFLHFQILRPYHIMTQQRQTVLISWVPERL